MFTIKLFDRDITVLEHMKEIKATSNGRLFNRFYNKKQMFSFFLGKDIYIMDGERSETPIRAKGTFGKLAALYVKCGETDNCIEFYRVEDITNVEEIQARVDSDYGYYIATADHLYASSFFVKDDAGQIYFVTTHED